MTLHLKQYKYIINFLFLKVIFNYIFNIQLTLA